MRLKTLSFLRGGLLPILFLLVALPTCLVFVHQVPPGQVADEPAHIVRADSLLKGEWVGHSGPQPQPDGAIATVAGVDADTSYLWVTSLAPPHTQPVDPVRLARARTMDWTGVQDFVGVNTIATYMPIFYAPSALGLAVARQGGRGRSRLSSWDAWPIPWLIWRWPRRHWLWPGGGGDCCSACWPCPWRCRWRRPSIRIA